MGGSRRVPLALARPAPAASPTATYVYGIVRSATRPAPPQRVTPLPGSATPRVLAVSPGQWAIVGDVPRKAFGEAVLEAQLTDLDWVSRCGAAHQAVVDAYLRRAAVVPMMLFTLFDSDERALAEMRRDAARLEASLDRVAGRTEWVVRVLRADPASRPPSEMNGPTRPAAAAMSATRGAATSASTARSASGPGSGPGSEPGSGAASGPGSGSGSASGSGRAFLLAKANERLAVRRRGQEADDAVRMLVRGLTAVADDFRPRADLEGIGAAAIFDAAFLVSASAEPRFKTEAKRLAAPLTERGYGVTVTGPWPCYSFVAEKAES